MLLLALLPLLLVLAPPASAWGPITHAYVACTANDAAASLAACARSRPTLFAAADAPDYAGFGFLNSSTANTCTAAVGHVHNLAFAGFMLQQRDAIAARVAHDVGSRVGVHVRRGGSVGNATEMIDDFTLGFASHIATDYVGFYGQGGVLCTKEAGGCTSNSILYMPEWSYMAAIDAYTYAKTDLASLGTALPVPDSSTMGSSDEVYAFVAQASSMFAETTSSFAPVSEAVFRACAVFWAPNMQFVYDRAAFVSSSEANLQFLHNELDWFNPTQGEFEAAWVGQTGCAVTVTKAFYADINSGVEPATAMANAGKLVAKLYADGQCK